MTYRAIIFDDNREMRSLLEHILQSRGYEVFSYSDPKASPFDSGNGCPRTCDRLCADIVICDLEMPGIMGTDFVRDLKNRGCGIPHMALISGNWVNGHLADAQTLTDAIFSKPIDFDKLSDWLKRCEADIQRERELSDWFLTATAAAVPG